VPVIGREVLTPDAITVTLPELGEGDVLLLD